MPSAVRHHDAADAAAPRALFRPRHRLTHARQFAAVYGAKVRKSDGPFTVFALPNGLPHCRLGLSVGRRVGSAVARNRVKRLVREAFRLMQHESPRGLDLVVTVAPHAPLELPRVAEHLRRCWQALEREWRKRDARRAAEGSE